jgi:hypothetical protein
MSSTTATPVNTKKRQRGSSSSEESTPNPKRFTNLTEHKPCSELTIIETTETVQTEEIFEVIQSPGSASSLDIYMEGHTILSNQELYRKLSDEMKVIATNQKADSQKIDQLASTQKTDSEKISQLLETHKFLEGEIKDAKRVASEAKSETVEFRTDLERLTLENKALKSM